MFGKLLVQRDIALLVERNLHDDLQCILSFSLAPEPDLVRQTHRISCDSCRKHHWDCRELVLIRSTLLSVGSMD